MGPRAKAMAKKAALQEERANQAAAAAEAAEAAAKASREEVQRLNKIIDTHAAEAKAKIAAAEAEAQKKQNEESNAANKAIPGLGGFGFRSMFGQQKADEKVPSLQRQTTISIEVP